MNDRKTAKTDDSPLEKLWRMKLRKNIGKSAQKKWPWSQIERFVDRIKICESSDVITKQRLNSISSPESTEVSREKTISFTKCSPCKESFMKNSTLLLRLVGVQMELSRFYFSWNNKTCFTVVRCHLSSPHSRLSSFSKFLIMTSTQKNILRTFYGFQWLCFSSCNSNSPHTSGAAKSFPPNRGGCAPDCKAFFTRSGSFHWEVSARELSHWNFPASSQLRQSSISSLPGYILLPWMWNVTLFRVKREELQWNYQRPWLATKRRNKNDPKMTAEITWQLFSRNFVILPSLSNRKFQLNFKDDDDKRCERMFWEGIWESFRVVKTRRKKKKNTNSIWNMFVTIKFFRFRRHFSKQRQPVNGCSILTTVIGYSQVLCRTLKLDLLSDTICCEFADNLIIQTHVCRHPRTCHTVKACDSCWEVVPSCYSFKNVFVSEAFNLVQSFRSKILCDTS